MNINLDTLVNQYVIMLKNTQIFKTDSGAQIKNSRGSCDIDGESSYLILLWLRKKLNGVNKVGDFLAIDGKKSNVILKIIKILITHEFAKLTENTTEDSDKKLILENNRVFQFIQNYSNKPLQTLKWFIGQPVILIGSGVILKNLAHCFECMGLKNIKIISSGIEINAKDKALNSHNASIKIVAIDKLSEYDTKILNLIKSIRISAIVYSHFSHIYSIDNFDKRISSLENYIKFEPNRENSLVSPSAAAIAANHIIMCMLSLHAESTKPAIRSISINQETLLMEPYEHAHH